MIPDEAVEAAARATQEVCEAYDPGGWTEEENWAIWARQILEAAAPHMLSHEREETRLAHLDAVVNRETSRAQLAEAWSKGHESGFWNGRLSQLSAPYDAPTPDIGLKHAEATNPYRNQP